MRYYILSTFLALTTLVSAQQALTLKEAILYGKANSPSLVIAANDRAKADAQASEALSGYLPQINGTGQLDDNLKRQTTILPAGIFSDQPTPVQFGTQYSTNLAVQADQTLIDVAQLNGIQANKPNLAMAAIKQEQTEEQLIYETARAYASALTYREQARLLDDNQRQYDELLPLLKLRLEKGVAQPLDVDRMEVTQRNLRSQYTAAQASYEIAVDQLKKVIGMPLDQPLELADSVLTTEDQLSYKGSGFSLTNLRTYKYSEQSLLLYGIDLKRKRNAFLPTLGAYGRYGAMAQGNDLGTSYDNWFDYAAIGLKLNVPLFSGLRRTSQIKQSEIALSTAREQLKLNSSQWEFDYRNADTRLTASTINAQNDEESLKLAERLFASTNLQYQQGLVPMSDLLTAEYQLKEARNNYTTSLLNRYLSIIDIERAQGTLLQFANSL
ncbi:MAG: TolC family protein [Flavobacteriales bacterium]|jgi:outer membrane protein|nr:TolC family protein [Flavobacteriales bacterium]MBK9514987.1 TolC family protein [Flavobacteriales bacterium]MBP6573520.1 TolC family protein [Flavobacteriales bacterium]